jgi:hypothetical protein
LIGLAYVFILKESTKSLEELKPHRSKENIAMKKFIPIFLSYVALFVTVGTASFDNFYFNLLRGGAQIEVTFYDHDGEPIGYGNGVVNGYVSVDGGTFHEEGKWKYYPINKEQDYSHTWRVIADGWYEMETQNAEGSLVRTEIKLLEKNEFEMVTVNANGNTIKTRGVLNDSGVIEAISETRTKDGAVMLTGVFIMKRACITTKSKDDTCS